MIRKILALLVILLPIGACSTALAPGADQSSAAAPDPAGRYEVAVQMRGQTRTGALRVVRGGTGWGGELEIPGLPPATVTGARVANADRIEVELRLPEGVAALDMNFDAAGLFTGELRIGDQRVPVRGRRIQ